MKTRGSGGDRCDALRLRNHCRAQRIDLRLLRQMIWELLHDGPARLEFQLDVHVIGTGEITRLNEAWLRHQGATDVLAFDYSSEADAGLRGEIFVCLPEAVAQARRFHTTWQSELVRYVVHAILHLRGYGDQTTGERRKMKRAEDAALRKLAARYGFERLALLTTGCA